MIQLFSNKHIPILIFALCVSLFQSTKAQAEQEYYGQMRNNFGTEWRVELTVSGSKLTGHMAFDGCIKCIVPHRRLSCETIDYQTGQQFELICRNAHRKQTFTGTVKGGSLSKWFKAGGGPITFIPVENKDKFLRFSRQTGRFDTRDFVTQVADAQQVPQPEKIQQALITPAPVPQPSPAPTALPEGADDSFNQLKTLKAMLDGGLISPADYEDRKRTILDKILNVSSTASSSSDDGGEDIQVQSVETKAVQPANPKIPNLDFGNYHAIVIGINDYKSLPRLATAINDANDVSATLRDHYGFSVTTLINPTRTEIIDVFDQYRVQLSTNDNLLIYYAGHGWLDEDADQGYWLPVEAAAQRRSSWVSNATISDSIRAVPAKHVMIVADSCYSGSLTRSVNLNFRSADYLERMVSKKARLVMTSGGLEPVSDGVGRNSPFARAFVQALKENTGVLDGTRLFTLIRRPVMVNASQTPEYADVKNTGHDGGDFILVRRDRK